MEQTNLELELLESALSNVHHKPKPKKNPTKTPLLTAKTFDPGFDSI